MKSIAIAVWLRLTAVLVIGTAIASTAMAQAQRKGEASVAKVWGYYRIVETETGGDGKVLLQVVVRLINRSGEDYSLNTMRMLSPSGGFYDEKTAERVVTALARGVTTVKLRFTVPVEDADRLREASRIALVLSMGDVEQATKTITAVLQRDADLREEN